MNRTPIFVIVIIVVLLLVTRKKEKFSTQRIPGQDTSDDILHRYEQQCSSYNVTPDPSKLTNYPYNFSSDDKLPSGQCPDSTFTYTTDLSRVIPGAPRVPSCVQLKDEPYCYSMPDGKFQPWKQKAMQVSL